MWCTCWHCRDSSPHSRTWPLTIVLQQPCASAWKPDSLAAGLTVTVGVAEAGWESLAGGKKQEEQANGGGGNSALLGDYVAPEIHVPVASSAEPSKPVRAEPEGTTPSQEPCVPC